MKRALIVILIVLGVSKSFAQQNSKWNIDIKNPAPSSDTQDCCVV
jgi:uncharacterized protein YdeI (BOF family)